LLFAGAIDGDASVRELALATLQASHNPQLFEFAMVQLTDLDPMLRLLGLDYLRKNDSQRAVPAVMQLLDDPDLRVVTAAEVNLMRWSGEDYGVRLRLATLSQEGADPGQVAPENLETIRLGVMRRKTWWKLRAKDYPKSQPQWVNSITNGPARLPLPDFTLKNLEGTTVRLSQFRGKVVVLNFWATWCTACIAEIPDLIALQNKTDKQVAILGVALDGVPDEHGHITADETEEKSEPREYRKNSLKNARAKVARAVKERGINYSVFWDPGSVVGGQFNGGELPTTVIIDAEGRMRRRFIGERSLTVFEAMVAEAARPVVQGPSLPVAQNN